MKSIGKASRSVAEWRFSYASVPLLPENIKRIRLRKAMYYYLRIWLPISLLTLPGGAVAFFAKKQNVLGAVILGIGNTIVALMGVSYFLKLYSAFPRHLLTVISCASIIVVLILGMQKRGKTRILSAATTVLLTAGVIIWAVLNERVI